jgi:hypothetical protein
MNPGVQEFAGLLKSYSQMVEIPTLQPEEKKYCALNFDGHVIHLELKEETQEIMFYATIAPLPANRRELLYETLLEANYFFQMTKGGTLGVDTTLKKIALVYQTPLPGLNIHEFDKMLEKFVNLSVFWKNQLHDWENILDDGSGPDAHRISDIFPKLV